VAAQAAEVAPDRVFGKIEFHGERFGYDLAVAAQALGDQVFSLAGQHAACSILTLHEITRKYRKYPE
jgi:hypothetical protein